MPIHEHSIIPQDRESILIEKVDYTNGVHVYLEGHKYPFKGMPTEGAVNAIAVIKKLLKFQPIQAMWTAIQPHILKEEFQQSITKEIIQMFPSKLGIAIAHVLEYDSAYRFRLQDLASETTKEALLAHPIQEIRRLAIISKRRDYDVAGKKIRYALYILMILLLIPRIRSKFNEGDFSKIQLDESDRYWLNLRTDYNAHA